MATEYMAAKDWASGTVKLVSHRDTVLAGTPNKSAICAWVMPRVLLRPIRLRGLNLYLPDRAGPTGLSSVLSND